MHITDVSLWSRIDREYTAGVFYQTTKNVSSVRTEIEYTADVNYTSTPEGAFLLPYQITLLFCNIQFPLT